MTTFELFVILVCWFYIGYLTRRGYLRFKRKHGNQQINNDAYTRLFGTNTSKAFYNGTLFLSALMYKIDFSKFKQDASIWENFCADETIDYGDPLIYEFASFIAYYQIRSIRIYDADTLNVCCCFVGLFEGKPISFWVFKGTQIKGLSSLVGYAKAYWRQKFKAAAQINNIVHLIESHNHNLNILCGHSYGGWLAYDVHASLKKNQRSCSSCYVYAPPWCSVQHLIRNVDVVFEYDEVRLLKADLVYVQTHYMDPVGENTVEASLFSFLNALCNSDNVFKEHGIRDMRYRHAIIDYAESKNGYILNSSIGLSAYIGCACVFGMVHNYYMYTFGEISKRWCNTPSVLYYATNKVYISYLLKTKDPYFAFQDPVLLHYLALLNIDSLKLLSEFIEVRKTLETIRGTLDQTE